jgi:hypothetical protein
MFPNRPQWIVIGGIAAILITASFALGMWAGRPKVISVIESPAKEIRQSPSSITLERVPLKIVPVKIQSNLKKLGIPGKVERIQEAVIEPEKPGPVAVTVIQTRTDDGVRTTIQTDNGQVISGKDFSFPVETVTQFNWTGLLLSRINNLGKKSYGAGLTYHKGRLAFHLAGFQDEIIVGAGLNW